MSSAAGQRVDLRHADLTQTLFLLLFLGLLLAACSRTAEAARPL